MPKPSDAAKSTKESGRTQMASKAAIAHAKAMPARATGGSSVAAAGSATGVTGGALATGLAGVKQPLQRIIWPTGYNPTVPQTGQV